MRPPGSSSPVSSKTMTPLHSRLHPCSGWAATVRAAAWSEASEAGQEGLCGHMTVPRFLFSAMSPKPPAKPTLRRCPLRPVCGQPSPAIVT